MTRDVKKQICMIVVVTLLVDLVRKFLSRDMWCVCVCVCVWVVSSRPSSKRSDPFLDHRDLPHA